MSRKNHPYLRKTRPEPFTGKLGVPAKKVAVVETIYNPPKDAT